MTASWRENRLTDRLGIEVPILSGAFGGLSSVALTAAVSDAGGLGAYGLYGYGPERIAATVAELRAATAAPFLLNLWVTDEAEAAPPAAAVVREAAERLAPFYAELGIELPDPPTRLLPSFEEQVEAVVAVRPAAVGFVFGLPDAASLARLREAGIAVLGTATTVEEALGLDAAGVDAIIASGAEAGGHRVSFLRPAEESLVGTIALVPQIVDAVSVPVVAAGGIADGRGIAAAVMLGAEGVQVGSAFLATRQSAASDGYRQAIASYRSRTTVLTRASSGRLARGIPNRLTAEAGADPAPFPLQNWLTGAVRRAAAERDETELIALWCGQAGPLAEVTDADALLRRLVEQTDRLLSDSSTDGPGGGRSTGNGGASRRT
ncbi:nitronate monooxygenase family protein [Naasia sp. SYSU D00057]|uniref:NAD(P)H-dependent flavin oxidoreductase n=1 Tax=Naasia sp. SYSU D00057 TaxID=2817380 RepID=UPI001B30CF1A|nr:nitronate monooxygenase family protein [Naasia sp. SYSU D00057]